MRSTGILLLLLLIAGCSEDDPKVDTGPAINAAADIYLVSSEDGTNYTTGEWTGNAAFVYENGITTLEVFLSNMQPGDEHAMHLHLGTLEVPGRHWNQGQFVAFCSERSLGEVWAKPFAGDVGNITIDSEGNGYFKIKTDLWSLGTGEDSDIEGTVLFIHQNFEDFANECDPSHTHDHGHSNAKIAGGTVILDAELLQ